MSHGSTAELSILPGEAMSAFLGRNVVRITLPHSPGEGEQLYLQDGRQDPLRWQESVSQRLQPNLKVKRQKDRTVSNLRKLS